MTTESHLDRIAHPSAVQVRCHALIGTFWASFSTHQDKHVEEKLSHATSAPDESESACMMTVSVADKDEKDVDKVLTHEFLWECPYGGP